MPKAKKTQSGSWKVRVLDHEEIIYDANGEPERKKNGKLKKKQYFRAFTVEDPSPAGRRAVEKMAADWLASKEDETRIEHLTVYEAIQKYICLKTEVLSPTTIRGYNILLRNSYGPIKDCYIDKLKKDLLQSWMNMFAANHSPKTCRNAWGLFTAALDMYAPGVKYNITLPMSRPVDYYTPSDDDVKKLLQHVHGTELEKAIMLAAFGALRRGEICALTSDDLNGNILTINKSRVRDGGKMVIKSPKTVSSYRCVELPDMVVQLFDGSDGKLVHLHPDNLTKYFEKAVKEAGLPHFRFHDLRHYSASIMHAIGIPDQYIMDRGGWKSDRVLKAVYRNVIGQEKRRFTDQINQHFDKMISEGT